MPQIFFDIKKPVPVEEKKEKTFFGKKEKNFSEPKKEKEKKPKTKRPAFQIFIISFLSILFVVSCLGVASYFFSIKAKILIWPKKDSLNSQIQVVADKGVKEINILAKTIPASYFQAEKTINQDFQVSGKSVKEIKAEGTIRVYNNYSTSSQVLIVGTRFISSDGKLFRTIERVVVPGQYSDKGKLQPGSIDAKVRADQPGESYNINPSTFAIPGFSGTPKYTGFYGKSTQPMTGGYKGEVSQITNKDIENAKQILSQKLFEDTKKLLKEKISSEFVLLDEAVKDKILEEQMPKAGTLTDSFNAQLRGSSEALAFKKSDLDNFASETILFQKPADKKFYKESLKTDYSLDKLDMDAGKFTLNLTITAEVYSEIDENQLENNILGKTPPQIRDFFSIQPQIEKIEIKLLPFWSKTIPSDENRIETQIRLD